MSDASIHFSEKWGGWNAHRLENSSENISTDGFREKQNEEKHTFHFLKYALRAFYF